MKSETFLIRCKMIGVNIPGWCWVAGDTIVTGRRKATPMFEDDALRRLAEYVAKYRNYKFEMIPNE